MGQSEKAQRAEEQERLAAAINRLLRYHARRADYQSLRVVAEHVAEELRRPEARGDVSPEWLADLSDRMRVLEQLGPSPSLDRTWRIISALVDAALADAADPNQQLLPAPFPVPSPFERAFEGEAPFDLA